MFINIFTFNYKKLFIFIFSLLGILESGFIVPSIEKKAVATCHWSR
jgi:hypothetical protein